MDLMTILPNLGFGELNRRKSRIWATILLFAMWYNGDRKCWTFAGFILSDQFVDLFDEDDIRFKQFENWSTGSGQTKKNSGFLISSGIMRTAADRWLSCVPTKC